MKSRRLVGLEVTSERAGDNSRFKRLLAQVLEAGKPSKILADSAYDSRKNFNLLSSLGIVAGIKPRKVYILPEEWERVKGRKRLGIRSKGSMERKEAVLNYSLNPEGWKKRIGYGERWFAEIFFSSFKRVFGEHVRARKFKNMANELMTKALLYNLFISL